MEGEQNPPPATRAGSASAVSGLQGAGKETASPPSLDSGRGRTAEHPADIPPTGWWDVLVRIGKDLNRDNVSLIAAGLALYGLLSVFPALTALVSLYSLFADPAQLVKEIASFGSLMPPGVWQLFQSQLQDMSNHGQASLTAAAAISVAVALWSARSGMSSLMTATNVAYQEREKRNFFVQIGLSLLFTIAAVVGFVLMLTLTVGVPGALRVLDTALWVQIIADALRWLLLWGLAVLALALIYRYAPSREPARWRWITWGSATAASLWLIGTVLFGFYIKTMASYQKTYGPLGDVVVLLMWFYLSSFLVVLGAEINSEAERQTVKDTTTGTRQPMGRRGAFSADTVGPGASEK